MRRSRSRYGQGARFTLYALQRATWQMARQTANTRNEIYYLFIQMNKHASALGKRGKGKPKTMSPDAILQRQNAAIISVQKRLEKKLKINVDATKTLP